MKDNQTVFLRGVWPEDDDYISRSQKKRDSSALQRLGEELLTLGDSQLAELEVPGELQAAIRDWRAFPGHEAKRRQAQYIGRLMRELDLGGLAERLDSLRRRHGSDNAVFHRLEALRSSLTQEDSHGRAKAMDQAARDYPQEFPRLKHLAEQAMAERAKNKPPKAFRELFRLLRKAAEEKME